MDDAIVDKHYSLVDEPWITVVYTDGTVRNVSLVTLFRDAPVIRTIAGEMPQMYFTTLRLALAILYRAYEFPVLTKERLIEEWVAIWSQGTFDLDIVEGYLEDYRDGFDLLSSNRPFYQVAGLEYMGKECDPISELMPDIPKPDKFLFAMRSPQSVQELSLDEAARYIVLAQAYDIAGIKSPVQGSTHVSGGRVYAPKGAVGTGWCGAIGGVFLEGENLFQTLLLNWVLWDTARSGGPLAEREGDVPPWELPSPAPDLSEADSAGPVKALTWQSRRIRLVFDESQQKAVGVISSYGDVTTAVDKQYCETMTAWRESEAQRKRLGTAHVPWMPQQHDASKALWRGLASMLSSRNVLGAGKDLRPGVIVWAQGLLDSRAISPDRLLSLHAQGMTYGTQSSVFEDAVDDRIDLCALMLRDDSQAVFNVLEVVSQADAAVSELVKFVRNMELAAGDKRRSGSFDNDVRERAYDALDQLFRERIAHFTTEVDPFDYCNVWRSGVREHLWALACSYVDEAGRSLFAEHDGMTSGRALHYFRTGLSRALGNAGMDVRPNGSEGTSE